jgi:uncharacterized protein with HEPN domain
MPRDSRAYLADIIIIGEAAASLSRVAPKLFHEITRARRVVDFRNQLTHAYATVDDAIVWAIIRHDVPLLRQECAALMHRLSPDDEGD